MLILTRKIGQVITISDNIKIIVTKIEGNRVGLGIDAPQEIQIYREERKNFSKSDN